MRFIQVSDVHLGAVPDANKPWSKERVEDIQTTFANVIKRSRDINADLLLICGDLFHHQPLLDDLVEVNALFETIPDTKICIIAGNRDRIRNNSSVLGFEFSKNVCYFLSGNPTSRFFPNINTLVHGFSYHSPEIKEPILDSVHAEEDGRIHILLAHGGDSNHVPINMQRLVDSNFTYVALGHIHKPHVIADKKIAYSGSLEPLSFEEAGEHGIIIGEINENTLEVENLIFEPMARINYIPLYVSLEGQPTKEYLNTQISEEITKRGIHNIFKIIISGKKDPDTIIDLLDLEQKYRILEITDETEPDYDLDELLKQHTGDLIGFYIQELKRSNLNEMSDMDKKALYYGINALLKTLK